MGLGHTGAKGMGHTGTVKGIFHISCSSRGMRKCAANKSAGVLTKGLIRGNPNSRLVMRCSDDDQRRDKRQSKQQGGCMRPGDLHGQRLSLRCRPASISRPNLHTSVSESTICCPGHNLHSMCICHGNVNP